MKTVKTGKRFPDNYCKFYVKKNWQILFFAILYITGLLIGVCFLYLSSQETLDLLEQVSEAFLASRAQGKSGKIFFSSFLSIFWYIGLFFLLGHIRGGKWAAAVLIWFRGLGNGLSMAGIYYEGGWSVLPVMAGVVTPVSFCQAMLLFWAAKMVWKYQEAVLTGERAERESRSYWITFLLLAALAAIPAGLDAILSACWM